MRRACSSGFIRLAQRPLADPRVRVPLQLQHAPDTELDERVFVDAAEAGNAPLREVVNKLLQSRWNVPEAAELERMAQLLLQELPVLRGLASGS